MSYGSIAPYLAGIGALSSIAGIGGHSGPTPAQLQQQSDLSQETAQAGNIAGIGNAEQSNFDTYNPQSNEAIQSYVDFLKSNPWTNQFTANALNQRTQGITAAGNAGEANIDAQAARNGVAGSSANLGKSVALQTGLASDRAAAANDVYNTQYNQHINALQNIYGVLTGAANTARTGAQSAYGTAAGEYGSAASGEGALNAAEQAQANRETDQGNAASNGLFGSVGDIYGAYLANKPQATPGTNVGAPTLPAPGGTGMPTPAIGGGFGGGAASGIGSAVSAFGG